MLARVGVYIIFLMLSGCYTTKDAYLPDYKNDYIYSVSYYGYHPFDGDEAYYRSIGSESIDFF